MRWLQRRGLWVLGWFLLAATLLMAVAWLALPSVLKSQGEQRLGALLGRAVSIGQVEFKPWSLELTVRQFQVAGLTGAATPLLRVERLYLNADARSLFRLAPVIEALEIDAPQVHLTRTAAGQYDIDEAGAAPEAPVLMAAEDRARAVKEIYKQTDIPGKPRNAVGIARDITGPEMEALLKTRIVVSAEAMRELALQRGLAVRDALIAQGLPSERLFLAAPKLRASGEDDATWSPRVQLTLAVN